MKITGPVWALGAMSGTSMDGVDAAVIQTDGERIFGFGEVGYRAYRDAERASIRKALGQWPGGPDVAQAAEVVETAHAELLSQFSADLIGFHGQTLAHDPAGRRTHQAGDGAVLAAVLNRPVVWDFRSSDVQMGGQGAPLAPFYHFACAKWIGATQPVAFLNLGGIGNLTWVDPSCDAPEDPGALVAFDTGPANAPIDDVARVVLGQRFDHGGAVAAQGQVDHGLVEQVLRDPYFAVMPPKSLDRSSFDGLCAAVRDLAAPDALASLVEIAAQAVALGMQHCPVPPRAVYVCGGGRQNAAMMAALRRLTGAEVAPVETVGLDGDMLEAQAFAYLAVRVARGLPTSQPGTTGVAAAIGGGVISPPA